MVLIAVVAVLLGLALLAGLMAHGRKKLADARRGLADIGRERVGL